MPTNQENKKKRKTKDKRGGLRLGAGRPNELEGGRGVDVYLDESTIAYFTGLGEGNLSAGIRKGAELLVGRSR